MTPDPQTQVERHALPSVATTELEKIVESHRPFSPPWDLAKHKWLDDVDIKYFWSHSREATPARRLIEEILAARYQRAKLQAQVERLKKALEPFAKYAATIEGPNWLPDPCPLSVAPALRATGISVGDCRRAAKALAATSAPREAEDLNHE